MARPRSLFCAAFGALIVASACDAPAPDTSEPIAAPEVAAQAEPQAPSEALEAPEAQAEQSRARRGVDPFTFEPERSPPTDEVLPPSTRGWLESARLVGILSGTTIPKAMFVDGQGHGHILTERDLFKDGARVVDIREREVEIALTPSRDEGAHNDVEPTSPKTPETIIVRLHRDELSLATLKHPSSPLH